MLILNQTLFFLQDVNSIHFLNQTSCIIVVFFFWDSVLDVAHWFELLVSLLSCKMNGSGSIPDLITSKDWHWCLKNYLNRFALRFWYDVHLQTILRNMWNLFFVFSIVSYFLNDFLLMFNVFKARFKVDDPWWNLVCPNEPRNVLVSLNDPW